MAFDSKNYASADALKKVIDMTKSNLNKKLNTTDYVVDSATSVSSTNPIQNGAITAYVNELYDAIDGVNASVVDILWNDGATPLIPVMDTYQDATGEVSSSGGYTGSIPGTIGDASWLPFDGDDTTYLKYYTTSAQGSIQYQFETAKYVRRIVAYIGNEGVADNFSVTVKVFTEGSGTSREYTLETKSVTGYAANTFGTFIWNVDKRIKTFQLIFSEKTSSNGNVRTYMVQAYGNGS